MSRSPPPPTSTAPSAARTQAFLKWRDVPVVDRVQALYRYKALLDKHADEIAAILTRENGKTTGRRQGWKSAA